MLHDAAYLGHTHVLAATLHSHGDRLLHDVDAHGQTLLHRAVAGRQVSTVKYLIGRCNADVLLCVLDADGNTPLHLYDGPPALLILLHLGGALVPPCDVRNAHSLRPIEMIAGAHGLSVQEAQTACDQVIADARTNTTLNTSEVLCFLRSSAVRNPPARARPSHWMRRARFRDWLLGLSPCAVALLASVISPSQLLYGLLPALLLTLAVILCRGGGPLLVARGLLSGDAHGMAVLTLGVISLLLGLQNALGLPSELHRAPALAVTHLVVQAVVVITYAAVTSLDPGFVPGGAEADHSLYWATFETPPSSASPPGHQVPEHVESSAGRSGREVGTDLQREGFCSRSELALRPRSRFSPFMRGMVKTMDHDCAFVGTCIGEGNHVSFLLLLVSASIAILTGEVRALADPPPWVHSQTDFSGSEPVHVPQDALRTRLWVLGIVVGFLTLAPMSVLLRDQCKLIALNVTSMEERRWQRTLGSRFAYDMIMGPIGVAHPVAKRAGSSMLHSTRGAYT